MSAERKVGFPGVLGRRDEKADKNVPTPNYRGEEHRAAKGLAQEWRQETGVVGRASAGFRGETGVMYQTELSRDEFSVTDPSIKVAEKPAAEPVTLVHLSTAVPERARRSGR